MHWWKTNKCCRCSFFFTHSVEISPFFFFSRVILRKNAIVCLTPALEKVKNWWPHTIVNWKPLGFGLLGQIKRDTWGATGFVFWKLKKIIGFSFLSKLFQLQRLRTAQYREPCYCKTLSPQQPGSYVHALYYIWIRGRCETKIEVYLYRSFNPNSHTASCLWRDVTPRRRPLTLAASGRCSICWATHVIKPLIPAVSVQHCVHWSLSGHWMPKPGGTETSQ